MVGHVLHVELVAGTGDQDVGQLAGQTRIRPVPGGQVDRGRIDLLHVHDVRTRGHVQTARVATAQHQHPMPGGGRTGQVLRIRDQQLRTGQFDLRGQFAAGRQQHRDRAEPRERRDGRQRAGPGLHHHADPGGRAHAERDQTAHHIVDALVDRLLGVHAVVEEEQVALRGAAGLLGEQAAQRDPGVRLDHAQPGEAGQRAGGLAGEFDGAAQGLPGHALDGLAQAGARLGEAAESVHGAGQPGAGVAARHLGAHPLNLLGHLAMRR